VERTPQAAANAKQVNARPEYLRSPRRSAGKAAACHADAATRTAKLADPMLVTIWAATRDGSATIWPVRSTSLKPYLLTSMNRAAPSPTRLCVRSPALFCLPHAPAR
jgi:hypothetical protein